MKNDAFEVMTLCGKCKADYENTGDYYICRTYSETPESGMGKCTKCPKSGWEYKITPKSERGKR